MLTRLAIDQADPNGDGTTIVSFKVKGDGTQELLTFLTVLAFLGSAGASRGFQVNEGNLDTSEDVKFFWDGDGSDKLSGLTVNGEPYVHPEKLPGEA